jgi:hypothetical protein
VPEKCLNRLHCRDGVVGTVAIHRRQSASRNDIDIGGGLEHSHHFRRAVFDLLDDGLRGGAVALCDKLKSTVPFPAAEKGGAMPAQAYDLLGALKRVKLTGRQQHGSIEIFHLRWPDANGLDYVTLDEALESQWIEVTEFTEAGQVPRIKIINRSGHMVFVMAGEQLVGCKQNRVVNASIMVPPHSEVPLPVTCVERGRWGYSSSVFSSAHTSSHRKLRAMMAGQAARSYREAGVPIADQASVWQEVSRKLGTTGSSSSSDALQDVFLNYERKLEESLENLPAPAECNGAVFIVGGRIAGADLFDKPATLRKLWPKLIKSCTLDALEPSMESPGLMAQEEISSWLDAAASATVESFPSPGVGRDMRIEGEDVMGASLVVAEHPVHMELFRPTEPQRARASGPLSAEPQRPANTERPTPDTRGRDRSWLRRIFS